MARPRSEDRTTIDDPDELMALAVYSARAKRVFGA